MYENLIRFSTQFYQGLFAIISCRRSRISISICFWQTLHPNSAERMDQGFQILYFLALCFHAIDRSKYWFLTTEHLITPVPPYPLGEFKIEISRLLLSKSWIIRLRNQSLKWLNIGRQRKLNTKWVVYMNVALTQYVGMSPQGTLY